MEARVHRRRTFLAGLAVTALSLRARAAPPAEERLNLANKRLAEIEAREGGRLGVFVRDTGTGATIEHRADERFPMCSTFKLLTAAAALKRVDEGAERLDRRIAYGPSDLLDYAPIAKAHVAEGGMTLADLCAAAIDWSDDTAANLVCKRSAARRLARFARSLGDTVTRLDRTEPTSINRSGTRATRQVRARWRRTCEKVLLGDTLSDASRRQLQTWLINDKVGDKRLRAGLRPRGESATRPAPATADRRIRSRSSGRPIVRPLSPRFITRNPPRRWMRATRSIEIGGLIAETFS